MTFEEPIEFYEAVQTLEDKGLLPTGMSTLELRELAPEIRNAAIFSARMNNAEAVQRFKDLVDQFLTPGGQAAGEKINIATMRAKMQDFLDEQGYDVTRGGFGAPLAARGSIEDLHSTSRLDLMLKTKVQQMGAAGYSIQQNSESARDSWPCYELVRVGVLKHPELMRDWPDRWKRAGGTLYGGRMIAPKDSEIWARLGSTELFEDALDTDYEPFAFNSHMVRFARPRALCEELGVIPKGFIPRPLKGSPIPQVSQALTTSFSQQFIDDLRRDLKAKIEGNTIRLAQNALRDVVAGRLARLVSMDLEEISAFALNAAEDQPRVPAGQPGGGEFAGAGTGGASGAPAQSAKSLRAKAAHVMVDKSIQRYAEEHNEPEVARALGGVSLADNEPADVILRDATGKITAGVELKTIVANSNAKITMKGDAIARKAAWERKTGAKMSTVVLDDSKVFNANGPGKHDPSQRVIYYRRGYGSFRISSMHVVQGGMAGLKTLLETPTRSLPKDARR